MWKKLSGFVGGFQWQIIGVATAALLVSGSLNVWQYNQIEKKNQALGVASAQLSNAAGAIRLRDNLISSMGQSGAEEWTNAEGECLAEVRRAYDAGRASVSDGVRNNAERQRGGAFGGSVPSDRKGRGPG